MLLAYEMDVEVEDDANNVCQITTPKSSYFLNFYFVKQTKSLKYDELNLSPFYFIILYLYLNHENK